MVSVVLNILFPKTVGVDEDTDSMGLAVLCALGRITAADVVTDGRL